MRLGAVAAVVLALAAGCGGESADDVLAETAAGIGEVRSADLRMRLVLEPLERSREGRVGFALSGPVDLGDGGLPTARLAYTQIAGPREGGATFIATGGETFVEVGGTAYHLPPEQARSLSRGAGAVRLPIGRWMHEPELEHGGEVDGTDTDRVSADLDAVTALRDIFGAAAAAGAEVPDLRGAAADELREAVDRATIDVWSGREDRLLRRLRLRLEFHVQPPRALRDELGDLAGARLAFDVDLGAVNEPVRVQAPADPRPAAELAG